MMAFITRTVKRLPTKVASLVELAIQNFASKGISLAESHITKTLEELENKETIKVNGDIISYVP